MCDADMEYRSVCLFQVLCHVCLESINIHASQIPILWHVAEYYCQGTCQHYNQEKLTV